MGAGPTPKRKVCIDEVKRIHLTPDFVAAEFTFREQFSVHGRLDETHGSRVSEIATT